MKFAFLFLGIATALSAAPLTYPETRRVDVTDTYHGVTVADPYRWLEDDRSAETETWVKAQNKVTQGYLGNIPERAGIKKRLTKLWNVERYGLPYYKGGHYFYTKNNGLQNQSPLYVSSSLDGKARVLLDPNTLSTTGTAALKGYEISPDGKWIAYAVSRDGSDWQEWKVRNIATGKDRDDLLTWVKFTSVSWTKDSQGFFYERYDAPEEGKAFTATNTVQKLSYHKLGTPQSADPVIYSRPDHPEWYLDNKVTDDGRYLLISARHGTDDKNFLCYKDLSKPDSKIIELLTTFDASYQYISNVGSLFYFVTDLDSPRMRVISIDFAKPDRANWKEIIPQTKDTLRSVSHIGGIFIATYMLDARSVVLRYDLTGKELVPIKLPGLGTVRGFSGDADRSETFYSFGSFTAPGSIYRYDSKTNTSTLYRQPKVHFDAAQFTTKQVFITSKDGTKVPVFLVHKKGIKLDGNNPTLLYAYGGFNISLQPRYSPATIQWMEMGGIYALANLRGGGEYGEEWHQAGALLNKQNVFDDFIAAAEWLISRKYTSKDKLAISGGSNGGLLVGACMTQRPDLYRAALPAVGVMDMLRYHKFTVGWGWVPEYGSSDDPRLFPLLRKYSPYHNLKVGTHYPATMVTTADHDDRVVPAHSFKFAAELQHAHRGKHPVLIRIETNSGHGAGTPTVKRIDAAADKHAFLVRELGVSSMK